MAQRRSSKRHSRRHSKRRSLVNRTLSESVSVVKNTMPKVKSGLETVGAKVTSTAKSSVPMLQQATRKFFSMFGIGSSKSRRHRRR